jgi:hypothetical protein
MTVCDDGFVSFKTVDHVTKVTSCVYVVDRGAEADQAHQESDIRAKHQDTVEALYHEDCESWNNESNLLKESIPRLREVKWARLWRREEKRRIRRDTSRICGWR